LRALNGLWKEADSKQSHVQRRGAELRRRGERRVREQAEEAMQRATDRPIHPNWVAHLAFVRVPRATIASGASPSAPPERSSNPARGAPGPDLLAVLAIVMGAVEVDELPGGSPGLKARLGDRVGHVHEVLVGSVQVE
jgi:hypothetical protein